MSHDFIENALTRLRDDSELVALRADKVRLTAEVRCLEAVIRSHERVDCLMVTSLKKQLVEVDAEVARLNSLIANSEHENARLKAEVERLTKAGYAMAVKINVHGIKDRFTDSQKLVDDWSNAAKEVQP